MPFRPRSQRLARPMLESLESRLLLTSQPLGHVDVLTTSLVAGWAYSADTGAAPASIVVSVDGTPTTLPANAQRDDLAGFLGSRYHGFAYTLPTLAPGNHTVRDDADNPGTGLVTMLAQQTLSKPAPIGHLDVADATRLIGWLYGTGTTPMNYRVDVGGVQGTVQTANLTRSDLRSFLGGSEFGFSVSGDFAGKVYQVWAIDAASGTPVLMFSNNTTPIGHIDRMNATTVAGWAFDADAGSGAVQVRVDVDGVQGTPVSANLARADLQSYLGSTAHGFSVTLPALTPGQHRVDVYAMDAGTSDAAPRLIGTGTVTDAVPTGYVDTFNTRQVSGWAYDADAGSSPIQVSVYVDDQIFTTVTANRSRPDLQGYLGSSNHGFSVDLSGLSPGSHSITVTLHDDHVSPSDEVVLYDDFLNNHQPIGSLDGASAAGVVGWAFDQDAGSDAIEVDVYVDGGWVGKATANGARPDLQNYLGSGNHGFLYSFPPLTFGTHQVELYASESQGNMSVLIGSTTVTNRPPVGSVDTVQPGLISGWAADLDATWIPVTVKLMVDGVVVSTQTASGARPDLSSALGTAHGFTFTPMLSSGRHEIAVLAVDANYQVVTLLTQVLTV